MLCILDRTLLNTRSIRSGTALLCALAGLLRPAGAAVVFVTPQQAGTADGRSWATAFPSVQQGLAAAAAGDEVWVAAGTYTELVALKSAVALYGGFSGIETSRADRDPGANVTVLDGGQRGSTVTAGPDVAVLAVMDGFTLRGGTGASPPAGAVLATGSHLELDRIRIEGNSTAGIYADSSTLSITGCTVEGNSGSGLVARGSSLSVARTSLRGNRVGLDSESSQIDLRDCVLSGNGGGGLSLADSTVTVANATIVANSGVGVAANGTHLTLSNSIIAFNSAGVALGSTLSTLKANDVYGNADFDYSGVADPTGQDGNLKTDPQLADLYRNPHLQPYSPCVDAGDDASITPGQLDIDGQPHTLGLHADIGADESDGKLYPAPVPTVVRVSPNGDDSADGSGWGKAKRTVAGALASAQAGDEVWVAAGEYPGAVSLRAGVGLYGGFAGTEATRQERAWWVNRSVLDGQGAGSVVTVGYYGCTIDGFTIRNGAGTPIGLQTYGGGILCLGDAALVQHNIITGNSAQNGGGLALGGSGVRVANNVVIQNSAQAGGGVYGSGGRFEVSNNTIGQNTAPGGGGIGLLAATARIANNIVAYNSSGIEVDGLLPSALDFAHNDVFASTDDDFAGMPDPTGTAGNIREDPLFLGFAGIDYHLTAGSPCVDAGDDASVLDSDRDLDGHPRIIGSRVDMGAVEFGTASPYTLQDVRRALLLASGIEAADAGDLARLNVAHSSSPTTVDLADAFLLFRKVVGVERNP